MKSSLLIGSVKLPSDVELFISAVKADVPSGTYYAFHDVTALSLAEVVCGLVVTATAATTCVPTLNEDRRITLTADVAFTIAWSADGVVRDALGFTGAGTGPAALAHTGANVSDRIWSPGQTESPDAPLGVIGTPASDTAVARSGNRIQVSTTHNDWLENSFFWRNVLMSRSITKDALGGEHATFYKKVLREGLTWNLWRDFDDVAGSSSTFTLVSDDKLGPYQMPLTPGNASAFVFERSKGLKRIDKMTIAEIPAFTVPEILGAS